MKVGWVKRNLCTLIISHNMSVKYQKKNVYSSTWTKWAHWSITKRLKFLSITRNHESHVQVYLVPNYIQKLLRIPAQNTKAQYNHENREVWGHSTK